MKIILLEDVFKNEYINRDEIYDVLRKHEERDDIYYVVKNKFNDDVSIHELFAHEIDSDKLNNNIKVGDIIKTTEEYKNTLYEPLYHEEILKGVVTEIDDTIATVRIIESTCDFSKRFNFHMKKWEEGIAHQISVYWLEKEANETNKIFSLEDKDR